MANLSANFILVVVKYTEVILKTKDYKALDLSDTRKFHNFQVFASIE